MTPAPYAISFDSLDASDYVPPMVYLQGRLTVPTSGLYQLSFPLQNVPPRFMIAPAIAGMSDADAVLAYVDAITAFARAIGGIQP